jgi:hypothetical protein
VGLPRASPALRHNPYVTKRGASPRGYPNDGRFFHESRRSISIAGARYKNVTVARYRNLTLSFPPSEQCT